MGARKATAVLRISPCSLRPGLLCDVVPSSGGLDENEDLLRALGKAGFYSAAFLLQRVLADALDVDPEEIEIASITRRKLSNGPFESWVGEIVLADRLPNGSGFVRELYDKFDHFVSLCLEPKYERPPVSYFAQYVRSPQHACGRSEHSDGRSESVGEPCLTACPRCLMTYYNSTFHGLLDWRLGMMTLRIVYDPDYVCGLDMNFDYPEFLGQATAAAKAVQVLKAAAGGKLREVFVPDNDRLPLALMRSENLLVGLAPGMWTRDAHEHYAELREFVERHNPDGLQVRWVDVFNVLRQTSRSLKELKLA
ncbi:MAG: hypothetical protein NZ534_00805 [Bacteroidia bacterium]|nr:hypothetical protein [Bacteroidia bacterium]